jgi:hypothetical protein
MLYARGRSCKEAEKEMLERFAKLREIVGATGEQMRRSWWTTIPGSVDWRQILRKGTDPATGFLSSRLMVNVFSSRGFYHVYDELPLDGLLTAKVTETVETEGIVGKRGRLLPDGL